MNRLLQWTSDWGGLICNFAIDRYGNLAPNPPGSACGMPIPLSFNGSNQIVGDIYDADGNLLGNGSGEQWSWNAENQLAQYQASSPATGAQYVYDGLGRRTEETVDGVTTLYLRNALGRVVDEVTGSNWTDSVIVPGAERTAIVSGPANGTPGGADHVYYLTADQVGTTRVITGQDGSNVAHCSQNSTYPYGSFFTFTPFGAELDCSQSTTDFKFTGKPRDPETGLDNFGARYNSSSLGRFMTPDPLGGHLIDPQNLNKYAYALNNPVTLTDPTGLDVWLQGCGNESDTCHNNYVGTWDKNKKTFTRTHLKGDLRKTATLGRHGISVKYDGHTYQGVWDTNKGENTPVMVSGAGALSGFAARVTGNCGGTCVANGQMLTAHLKSPTNLAFGVFNSLNGAPGWRKNPGWEGALDFFHPGATNFHGYAQNDPEGLSSTHLPIVLAPNATVPWHVDQRYAWEDGVGFVQHTGSAIHNIFNSLLGGGGQ